MARSRWAGDSGRGTQPVILVVLLACGLVSPGLWFTADEPATSGPVVDLPLSMSRISQSSSMAISSGGSYAWNNYGTEDFSWSGLAINTGIGAVTGAASGLMGFGAGAVVGKVVGSALSSSTSTFLGTLGGRVVTNAAAGAVTGGLSGSADYVVGSLVTGQEMSWSGLGQAAGTGAVTGLIGGAISGAMPAKSTSNTLGETKTTNQSGSKPASNTSSNAEVPGKANISPKICSFTGATLVLMADGTSRAIEELRPGDQVVSWDPGSGSGSVESVTAVWPHDDRVVTLSLSDGSSIDTTAKHPWWVPDRHQFIRTDHLSVGDGLQTAAGETVTVQEITTLDMDRVYDLTVTGPHTYYVGDTPTLAHNCSANGPAGMTPNSSLAQPTPPGTTTPGGTPTGTRAC